jgi:hypothetical protein
VCLYQQSKTGLATAKQRTNIMTTLCTPEGENVDAVDRSPIATSGVSGIYKIHCSVSDNVYIGQSVNIPVRWNRHKLDLSRNAHCNSHLQAAWNLYGPDAFTFSILETTSPEHLNDRERFWILETKAHNPRHGYNMSLGGDNATYTEEQLLVRCLLADYKKRPAPIYLPPLPKLPPVEVPPNSTTEYVYVVINTAADANLMHFDHSTDPASHWDSELTLLRTGTHPNWKLQYDFSRHNETDFQMSIVCAVPESVGPDLFTLNWQIRLHTFQSQYGYDTTKPARDIDALSLEQKYVKRARIRNPRSRFDYEQLNILLNIQALQAPDYKKLCHTYVIYRDGFLAARKGGHTRLWSEARLYSSAETARRHCADNEIALPAAQLLPPAPS